MNRLALCAAVAVLALGGVAIAQTPPPADEPDAPAIEAAPEAGPATDEAAPPMRPMRPGMGHPGMGRPGMGPGGPGMGMMRHPGPMPQPAEFKLPDTKGAVFVFEGPGRGRIIIKCADEDSTQSCAEAVKPLVDTIADRGRGPGMGMGMPGRGPGNGPGMGMGMGGQGRGNGPCMGQGPGGGPGQGQGMGQGMGRGPCGGGMGPGGPAAADPAQPAQNQ